MPTSKEMSVRRPVLHKEGERIERAQSHSMCKALDSPIWFAEQEFDVAAGRPRQGQVRIDQQCSVNERRAIVDISDDIGERVSRETEYERIVVTRLHSASGQPSSLGNLLLLVDDPASPLASGKVPCGCGIRRGEIRIKFNGFVKQAERFLIPLSSPFVIICQSAHKQVVGIEVCGWFAPGTFDFCLLEPRGDCAHHTCGHPVLQLEYVLNCTFEAIRPKMCTR